MSTDVLTHPTVTIETPDHIRPGPVATRLVLALIAVTALNSALSFFVEDILTGPAVMNGSARGTALVLLVLTVPMTIVGTAWAAKGSALGLLLVMGGVAHVLYQSVLFLFATPFNDLFLLYVAMLALAIWSSVALAMDVEPSAVRARIRPGMPVRPIAIYVWVVVVLNTVAWLGFIIPGLAEDGFPTFLEGSGMTTNPIHIQDLAFWLPLMAVAAWWFRQERDLGYVLIGAMLTMWLLESVTVAVDQVIGHAADPTTDIATIGGAWLFTVMAVIGLVPWLVFHRRVMRT